jgi:hypothetical protein
MLSIILLSISLASVCVSVQIESIKTCRHFNTYFSIHLCRNRSYYLYCVHPKQNKTKAYLCAADSKRSDKYGLTDISNKSNKLNSKSNSKCCQKSVHWFDSCCESKQCSSEFLSSNETVN